ncbi:MAG: hypothetical protein RLZZ127_2920 [Planctomycetota bacterium]|jgi:hypothetical protein
MSRTLWIGVGLSAQVAFHLLVPALIWFMHFGASVPATSTWGPAADLAFDALLILGFVVPHSILLMPPVRSWINRHAPPALWGSLFTWATTIALAAMILLWRPVAGPVWELHGTAYGVMLAAAAASWLALAYSMWLGGFGWQTGWTAFHAWWRGQPIPRRDLCDRGAYAVFRHPIYASFVAISWTAPTMDTGHLLLSGMMTAYCLMGSVAKDRRLLRFIGEPYRAYMARVPGWPAMPRGMFGRAA